MEDLIKHISTELTAVQDTISRIIQHEEVSIEDKVSLFTFFKKHEQVSDLVDFINTNNSPLADIISLSNTCQTFIGFYDANATAISSFNPKEESDTYLAPYREEERREGQLWAEYDTQMRQLSNIMDYMDMDSEEFWQKDAECDRLRILRDTHKANQDKASTILREKEQPIMGFYFFVPEMLMVLVSRMNDVCNLLISKIEKGGSV